jgi:four helix bundle protein
MRLGRLMAHTGGTTGGRMQDFKKLKVWQKSVEQQLDIYKTTESFPGTELHRMIDQFRRAADSVKENIAEGCGKSTDADFRRYVSNALGSQFEIESRLISARELKFLALMDFERLTARCHEMRRMLLALMRALASPRKRPPPEAGRS